MISEPGDGRIYVTTPDGLWSFNSSAHNVPRAAFDALREQNGKLERVREAAKELRFIERCHKHMMLPGVTIEEVRARLDAALAGCEEVGK